MDSRFGTLVNDGFSYYCGTVQLTRNLKGLFSNKTFWNGIAVQMGFDPLSAYVDGLPEKIVMEDARRKDLNTLFYEGVINCIYPDDEVRNTKFYHGVKHYRINVSQHFKIIEGENPLSAAVNRIDFYILTRDIMVYCISTDLTGMPISSIALQNFYFRDLDRYTSFMEKESMSLQVLKLFYPVVAMKLLMQGRYKQPEDISRYAPGDYSLNLFIGHKLKIYMGLSVPGTLFDEKYSYDNFLYEMGTAVKIPGVMMDPQDFYYPAPSYYQQILSENKLEYFNNWSGLALRDSFVVIFKDSPKVGYYWGHDYFEFLYLNALCTKAFLAACNYDYNRQESTDRLEEKLLRFNKAFSFDHVSYNFLPNLIYNKIKNGLEIDMELEHLNSRIERYTEKQSARNEKKTGIIVFLITILAIFSAVSDAFQLYQIVGSNLYVTVIVGSVIALIILLCVCIRFLKVPRWLNKMIYR